MNPRTITTSALIKKNDRMLPKKQTAVNKHPWLALRTPLSPPTLTHNQSPYMPMLDPQLHAAYTQSPRQDCLAYLSAG